ncbi:MAG TPA: hypothetical protein VJS92_15800 [Candidatus Polarisedimenticolaceae bacterium]|nr:hypothetical protein [Candidatus Polarisedimenticolaceae bacterium]
MSATQAQFSTVDELRALPILERRRGRNVTKADVLRVRHGTVELALKDYSARPWLVRTTLCRWLVRRECAAFDAARGVAGLPRFFGRLGPFTLATAWVEARPLAEFRYPPGPDPRCFERVSAILDELHACGVALWDLHHRDVLVGADAIHLVDLATAWIAGPRAGRLRRFVFALACDQDRVNLARMRARYTGGDVAAAAQDVGRRAALLHGLGRRLRQLVWRGGRRGER